MIQTCEKAIEILFGLKTEAIVLAFFNIEKFNFAKQVVAFAGLNLKHSQSCTFIHCASRISRTGNVNNLCKKLIICLCYVCLNTISHAVFFQQQAHIRFVMCTNTI
ncbi:IS110 family transposase [Orientia tsutsugamushi str. Gilliam]|uniref:IS110 family transposase n=1 Tax=Orientia tsutsugamushi str. Gilliam TaxID=1359184 RepID=A0A2U3REF7_ORITS|nr:IS110 family transposase [Orientia tsutsugamushi str. Gilliam]